MSSEITAFARRCHDFPGFRGPDSPAQQICGADEDITLGSEPCDKIVGSGYVPEQGIGGGFRFVFHGITFLGGRGPGLGRFRSLFQ